MNKLSLGLLMGCVLVLFGLSEYQASVIARQRTELTGMIKAPCGFSFKSPEPQHKPAVRVLPKSI